MKPTRIFLATVITMSILQLAEARTPEQVRHEEDTIGSYCYYKRDKFRDDDQITLMVTGKNSQGAYSRYAINPEIATAIMNMQRQKDKEELERLGIDPLPECK